MAWLPPRRPRLRAARAEDADVRLPMALVVVGLACLHFLLHVGLGAGRAAPDLLTVGLLIAARELRTGQAAGLGFALGLLQDALSVLALGANTLTMTMLGIAGARTRELFVGDSLLFVISYFFIGKWLRDIVYWILVGEELRRPFVEQALLQGVTGAAYAAVVGLLVLGVTGLSAER